MVWKRPRKAPVESAAEMLVDVEHRLESVSRDRSAGPLELLGMSGHPMVRAALRSGRRERLVATAACSALPVLVFGAAMFVSISPLGPVAAGWIAGLFAGLWPLVCFVGAALGAGSSVIAERDRGTAEPLVLTPMPKRVIAAARVLPAALPYVCGAVAAFPVLTMAGGVEPIAILGGFPTPLALWPLRVAAPLFGGFGPGRLTLPGFFVGFLMCLTDLALVWAAAHWGAAYGVRLGRLPLLVGAIVWRLGLTLLYFLLCMAGVGGVAWSFWMLFGWVLTHFTGDLLPVVLIFGPALFFFLRVWYKYVLKWPVGMVLAEFSHFDELAQDDFQPRPLRGWEIIASYGQRT